jgi:hypothetical protein
MYHLQHLGNMIMLRGSHFTSVNHGMRRQEQESHYARRESRQISQMMPLPRSLPPRQGHQGPWPKHATAQISTHTLRKPNRADTNVPTACAACLYRPSLGWHDEPFTGHASQGHRSIHASQQLMHTGKAGDVIQPKQLSQPASSSHTLAYASTSAAQCQQDTSFCTATHRLRH